MAKRSYPYQAFVVTPSMNIKEVKIVEQYDSWNRQNLWDVTEKNTTYHVDHLHLTHAEALVAAEKTLQDQEARHKKATENLAKRRANLEKIKAK